ncbi:MAG: hypothetical protein ACXVCV_17000 [Polyangia bacterium]
MLTLLALSSSARAKETLEYMDLLTTEAVGELSTQTYDERVDKKFVGTREAAGVLVGGGIGIRPVFRFANGLRFSVEVSGTWGRLRDADPGVAYSTVTRAEFLTGLGYEIHVGRALALHTATLVGLDAAWMDRAQQIVLFDASANASPIQSSSLSRVDLRLGQQLGAHVQLAKAVALYADGTLDYDGQWRVRAGIAIGQILR